MSPHAEVEARGHRRDRTSPGGLRRRTPAQPREPGAVFCALSRGNV